MLLDTTLDVLAEAGVARVNADLVATRVGCGKAAIYRRWRSISTLVVSAVHTCQLVPEVPNTGLLRTDLVALLEPWLHPLNRCERAAASLLGHAGLSIEFNNALDQGVVQPLSVVIAHICDSHGRRGLAIPLAQTQLLRMVVQSLWWQRYVTNPSPSTVAEVDALVDQILLPVALST